MHLCTLHLYQIPNPLFVLIATGLLRNLPNHCPKIQVARSPVRKTGRAFDINFTRWKLVGLAGAPGRRRGANGGVDCSPANMGIGRRWAMGRVCGGWVPCYCCCECELHELLLIRESLYGRASSQALTWETRKRHKFLRKLKLNLKPQKL